MASILRRIPDVASLPRIRLCDLKDLPGARKAVSSRLNGGFKKQNSRILPLLGAPEGTRSGIKAWKDVWQGSQRTGTAEQKAEDRI